MLHLTGYLAPEDYVDPVQPPAVLWGIRATLGVTVIVVMGWAWWLAGRYPLTRARCIEMQVELEERGGVGRA